MTSSKPLEQAKVNSYGGSSPEWDTGARLASPIPEQARASLPKRWFSNTKTKRGIGNRFRCPKSVIMRRKTLEVNHALYSRMTKGGDFHFFH